MFTYIVCVECWNVNNSNLIHMLDFVQGGSAPKEFERRHTLLAKSSRISTQLFREDVNLGKCVGRETLKVDIFTEDMWRCISSGKMSTTVELRVFPEEAIFPNCCCIKIE